MEVHLPNGVEKCDEGVGRQWFALEGDNINVWKKAFSDNSSKIMSYIDSVMSEKHLGYENVIFAGFSQGAMLSLSLGLKHQVSSVIAFSGLLLDPENCPHCGAGDINAPCKTRVLLTHGEKDSVIPVNAMTLTEEALKSLGISVKTVTSPNLTHGIDEYLLDHAVDFLKAV
jgi:phospholipase/carboxylesterase